MAKLPVTVKKRLEQQVSSAKVETKQPHSSRKFLHQTASFEGLMPPPAIVEGYESLVSGAAERILAMAESETKYQHEIGFASLSAMESEVKRRKIFAFVIWFGGFISFYVYLVNGFSNYCRND